MTSNKESASSQLELLMARANAGDAIACYELGLIYAVGQGAESDLVTAHKWLNLAASHGERRAAAERAAVAEEMSASDIASAQRQAREWINQRQACAA